MAYNRSKGRGALKKNSPTKKSVTIKDCGMFLVTNVERGSREDTTKDLNDGYQQSI